MSNLRRWARVYYNLSPIFHDSLFQKAGNEALAAINPRLFAAYCIKMAKLNIYSKEKINELVKQYFSAPNYWTTYTLQLLQTQQKAISDVDQDIDSARLTFEALISKFYYQTITKKEFKLMCECIRTLQVKKKVTQLDYYVLDISFDSIDQVVEIAQIGEETAIEAIGDNALQLIEKSAKSEINPYPFQLINLFNRLKDTASLSPQLTNLHSMLQGSKKVSELFNNTRKDSGICMRKQAIGYMLWLLNVNELGEFVSRFAKQDYLFIRYCQNSVQLTCNILQVIEVSPSMSLSELLVLNETVHKLQDMQEQKNFFEHVKRNVLIEVKLKNLKEKIMQNIHRLGQGNFQSHEWIREVDKIEIDFKSSLSINIIRKAIIKLMENQHFTLILPDNYFPMLLRLCLKTSEFDLYKKLKSKIEKRRSVVNDRRPGLLLHFEKFYDNEVMNKYANFQIYSIYELKRIKNFCLKFGDRIQKMIQQMNNNDVELLKSFLEMLKKGPKDISHHEVDHKFARLFQHFKL